MESTKNYYRIILSADCDSIGLILLTQEEAEIFNTLLQPESWTASKVSVFGGYAKVECDFPLSEEFINYCSVNCSVLLEEDVEILHGLQTKIQELVDKGINREDAYKEILRYFIKE